MGQNLTSPTTVRELLHRYDIRPSRRRGQSFLIDANALARVLDAAELGPQDGVLEVGPGLGVLTAALAQRVLKVVAVEVDRRLADALEAEIMPGRPNIQLVRADVLDLDLHRLMAAQVGPGRHKVVANIPYSITGPLVARILEAHLVFECAVLLLQKEVAARLIAWPGSPEYSALTLLAALYSDVDRIGTVSRTCFYPTPDVDSTIVRLRLLPRPRCGDTDPALVMSIVHAAFHQRRKTLRNSLAGSPTLLWSLDRVEGRLRAARIDPARRGETLSLAEFVRLATVARDSE